ncbi:BTAD domain-containing putative transcriptional regulator [Candidatus Contubernalis alkaliaceticus]|uniref:BTAD domain-containing putative transcriptional regulator n=1 Tax=Candidatus Contubernalis alkaliaceticus TaxID=338645 RepID=UPI001F4C4650|nr:BTAD domain-containing putative transcriptional regulator [Candidatus Contubernalis alkalaceticus]UNC92449.1 response regulator [Candidatus Contubernalis alkalaceticus]
MIKVILIYDEKPALRKLEYLLQKYPLIEIVGIYKNSPKVIKNIQLLKPQAVFMDINVPICKVVIASKIVELCPLTDIIFVTAYDQYAVEAFELHALDYIMKPFSKERLDKTIQRIIRKNCREKLQCTEKKFKIITFGRFEAGWEGQEPIKFRSRKTKELFAFLLQHADLEITKDEILEALWTDIVINRAVHQLHNCIYYIRKTLQDYGVERKRITIEGKYKLKLGEIEIDRTQFIQSIRNENRDLEMLEQTEALYRGDYLEGDYWGVWVEAERERLSKYYFNIVLELAEIYIRSERFIPAEELLLKAFKKNPYNEKVSKSLINLYILTNRRASVLKHYREYERILRKDLGLRPDDQLKKIMEKI